MSLSVCCLEDRQAWQILLADQPPFAFDSVLHFPLKSHLGGIEAKAKEFSWP